MRTCKNCGGRGLNVTAGDIMVPCGRCRGTGRVRTEPSILAREERTVVRGLLVAFTIVVAIVPPATMWWVDGSSFTSIVVTVIAVAALVTVARRLRSP